ncbi:MAG: histidine phosphatase family protein [Ilumatobacter sp.]|nr:histidine phosphatase family protein [Ilumatobacter sp.]
MAQLYLVRHAKAGERRLWDADDIERPLSKKGWKQAELVGKRLAKLEPEVLLSSAYVRCIQTLEPLGERIDVKVEVDERLTEYEPVEPLLELIREAPKGTVMCSHGDLIPAAIDRLKRGGAKIATQPDWRKASVWVLQRSKNGTIVKATAWPPPVL